MSKLQKYLKTIRFKKNLFTLFLAYILSHNAIASFFNVGFLHDQDIKGSNTKIAVIEYGLIDSSHPVFRSAYEKNEIIFYPFINLEKFKAQALATPDSLFHKYFRAVFNMIYEKPAYNDHHANAVVGVIKGDSMDAYKGGLAPSCQIYNYQRSACRPFEYEFDGTINGDGAGLAVKTIDE